MISGNAIWLAVAASTNSLPASSNANWRKIADVSSGTGMIYSPIITNTTAIPAGEYSTTADTSLGTVEVYLPLLSSLRSAPYTTDMIQAFYVFKASQLNALTVILSGSDQFIDGTTTTSLSGQGAYVFLRSLAA